MRNSRTGTAAATALTLALVVGASACGSSSNPTTATTQTASTTTTLPASTTSTSASAATTTTMAPSVSVAVYLIRSEKMAAARADGRSNDALRFALDALLQGPTFLKAAPGLTSAIPQGTRLLSVKTAGGVATVNMTNEFASGGGSLSMTERIAQVVFTATQFPSVQKVAFEIDGQPVKALGGEGVVIDSPQSRADWESASPAILLETPYPGDVLSSPVAVRGTADVFEATFRVRIKDRNGQVLADEMVMATSGTGTRGTFEKQMAYSVTDRGPGTLTVYENSARDGSEINVVTIPVTLG